MITDCIGRVIMKLPEEDRPPGDYNEQINISNLARGVYLFVASFNGEVQTRKFVKI
jgi:hypothetical protein